MTDQPAVQVERLSKRYVIAHDRRHDTLRDALSHGTRGLWASLRRGSAPRPGRHEEFWALRDVSLEVGRGEVLGIIGRNGAGKSTLLKLLSRITEPTRGRITMRGRVSSLLEVGTGFHPELSGRENIFLNGAILGMSRAEIRRKFDEIVAFAGVERFLDTPVKRYSSGMYVRLAFAVAAHLDPEILIIDEVLAVGDADFQSRCLGKLESIAQAGARAILFVSHNMSAVARFCRRVVLLDEGRVILDGPAQRAIDVYLNRQTKASDGVIKLPPPSGSAAGPLVLSTVSFNGGESVIHRQPFRVTVGVTAGRPVAQFGVGLGLCDIDGRRILTLESDYRRAFFSAAHPGTYTVQLRLPSLDLVPGRYRIDVGAFDSKHQALHYAPDCMLLEVQPGDQSPPHLDRVYGDYRPDADWKLTAD